MKYKKSIIIQLLKKEMEGSLTDDDQLFLRHIRPLFEDDEWQDMEIDATLELPEKSSPEQLAEIDRMLKEAAKEAQKRISDHMAAPKGGAGSS